MPVSQSRPARVGGRWKLPRIVKQSIGSFLEDDCLTLSAALAYYSVFSLAPLLLTLVSAGGLLFGREVMLHEFQGQVEGLIGAGAAQQVQTMLEGAAQRSGGAIGTVVWGLLVIFGATGAFAALQDALNRVWRVKPDPAVSEVRLFLMKRVLSFGLIVGLGFLMMVSLALGAALAFIGKWAGAYLPAGISAGVLQAMGAMASFGVTTSLFAIMFHVLPDAETVWRHDWVGATVTSLLFTFGKTALGIYLGQSGMASAYGAAGSFVLIVVWLYYASIIVLWGAEFTKAWSAAHGVGSQPEEGAVHVEVEERIEPRR